MTPLSASDPFEGLKQVSFEAFQEFREGGAPKSGAQRSSGASVGEFERAAKRAAGNAFLFQTQ